MDKLDTATVYEIAERAHKGQKRRDGVTDYIEHVLAVAQRTAKMTDWDQQAVQVALLHDVLEDTQVTEFELREAGVDEEVIAAVKLLTKSVGQSYDAYVKRLVETKNRLALIVKKADILSNLADEPTDKQIKKYANALLILL